MYNMNRQNEQIYGRNSMVMLDGHNKIYGSLGIAEPYVLQSQEGTSIVARGIKEGGFDDVVTEFCMFGKSEQFTTIGAQLFDAETSLKKQIDSGIVSVNDDGSIMLNGTFNSSNRDFSITLQPGTYYLSCDDGNVLHILATADSLWNRALVVEAEQKFSCYISSGVYNNKVIRAMINEGSTAKPWEPYTGGQPSPNPDYPQEITSVGDDGEIEVTMVNDGYVEKGMALNIIKKIALKKGSYIYCKNQIKSSIMNAFIVNDPDLIATSGGAISNGNSLHSYCYNNLGMVTIEKSGTTITKNARIYQYWESGVVYRIDSDGLYLYYSINNSSYNDTEDGFVWFLDHEGSKERPYASQSLIVSTPNGLPGIPVTSGGNYTDSTGQQWICDEVDFKRGKYVQRVTPITLGGSDLQQAFSSERYGTYVNTNRGNLLSGDTQKLVMSDQYIGVAYNDRTTLADGFRTYLDRGRLVIRLPVGDNRSLEEIKVAVDEQKPHFLCTLATPIETDLTPEQMEQFSALRSYYPTTVVMNDEDVWMKMSYKALEMGV